MTNGIIITVCITLVILATIWANSSYCAESDLETAKQTYQTCTSHALGTDPLCARVSTEMSCKRWARW